MRSCAVTTGITTGKQFLFQVVRTPNHVSRQYLISSKGGPPKFVSPVLPAILPPNKGHQFVDRNASHVPKYPFEPLFQAISITNPNFRFDNIDIIANRNSFRKFLDFVTGRRQDPFCMDLHLVKNTLVIGRRERNARSMIYGAPNSGYGHSFERAFTVPEAGLDHSSSHHRVITYRLGHLNCAVRFEVDAYYDNGKEDEEPGIVDSIERDTEIPTLAISQITIKDSPQPLPGSARVIAKGTNIPISKLAELKAHKAEKATAAIPQLWFGRTPYLLTGIHTSGTVKEVKFAHIESRYADWETANQENLRKLVSVLGEVKEAVEKMGNGAAVLVCREKGAPIEIMEMRNKTSVLPEDSLRRFWSFEVDL